MNFVQFAAAHGVIVRDPIMGRWRRVPTDDHPRSRNGAYKLLDRIGWVQNWASMTEPATWHADGDSAVAPVDRALIEQAARETRQRNAAAARKAEWVLSQCELAVHPYFASKGFPDHMVNVWDDKAAIPMRAGGRIVGCQLIDADGTKKFLSGQASAGAEFVMDGKGVTVLCEGYATGLSVHAALANLKTRATIHVCFSAGNMKRIAERVPRGIVIADNDASGTGERVAKEIGWPYWISDTVGEDSNDFHQRAGLFQLAMGLRRAMRC